MTLYCVCLHAVKITYRRGVPQVEQGVSVGPLAAEDEPTVTAWAEAAVKQRFPTYKGWSGHAYTFCETPATVLDQVRPAPPEPTLPRKQRRKERETNREL